MWCEGVCEMQEGLVRPKKIVPTDDVWMARAVADWATGGAGFTQQDVGVWALLHQPSWTHKRRDVHTQSLAESQRRCAWGAWLSACFKLEVACFPEERNEKIIKGRGLFQLHIVRSLCLKQQEHDDWTAPGLNQKYTHIRSQDLLRSCTRSVSPLVDCSQVFYTRL